MEIAVNSTICKSYVQFGRYFGSNQLLASPEHVCLGVDVDSMHIQRYLLRLCVYVYASRCTIID
jgi:hypothetical protein